MLKRKREIAEGQSRRAVDDRKTGVTQGHICRRYPIGAELIGANETHFRVWAPKAQHVDLVLEDSAEKNANRTFHPLAREDGGYFSAVTHAAAGSLYRFRGSERDGRKIAAVLARQRMKSSVRIFFRTVFEDKINMLRLGRPNAKVRFVRTDQFRSDRISAADVPLSHASLSVINRAPALPFGDFSFPF